MPPVYDPKKEKKGNPGPSPNSQFLGSRRIHIGLAVIAQLTFVIKRQTDTQSDTSITVTAFNSSPLYICGKEKVCCTHEECRCSAHRPSLGREPSQLQGTTTINSFNWYRIILLGDNKLRITCPTLLPDSDG